MNNFSKKGGKLLPPTMNHLTSEDEELQLPTRHDERRLRASIQHVRCDYDGNMTIEMEEGTNIYAL